LTTDRGDARMPPRSSLVGAKARRWRSLRGRRRRSGRCGRHAAGPSSSWRSQGRRAGAGDPHVGGGPADAGGSALARARRGLRPLLRRDRARTAARPAPDNRPPLSAPLSLRPGGVGVARPPARAPDRGRGLAGKGNGRRSACGEGQSQADRRRCHSGTGRDRCPRPSGLCDTPAGPMLPPPCLWHNPPLPCGKCRGGGWPVLATPNPRQATPPGHRRGALLLCVATCHDAVRPVSPVAEGRCRDRRTS
jgi:hypothetical protein